jgi:large subunit ribosomal protein L28
MVSEKNEIKTRRHWRPNVHSKRLWSNALQAYIKTRITTRVLRTVDKVGGLDEYLLGEKSGRIKELGMAGWKLRWRIMQTDAIKERFRLQREQMGLPPKGELLVTSNGALATEQQVAEEIRQFDESLEMGQDVDIGQEAGEFAAEEAEFMQEEAARPGKVVL